MSKQRPKLSVVIPVYNEEKTIEKVISQVRDSGVKNIEIVVVDDKSVDGTRAILAKLYKDKKIDQLVLKKENAGKGSAIKLGFKKATGEMIIIQDADLEYHPSEFPKLIKPIEDGLADVVYGSRFQGSEAHRVVYFWHYLANTLLTLLSNIFTNLNLTDMETGYKVFKADILKDIDLQENSFGMEPEITAKIAKKKARIYEVGISYHGRTYEEGKKIGLKDAFRAVYAIVKYNILE
jgi:glycosyltransferase involved in cell wall biosynthesis